MSRALALALALAAAALAVLALADEARAATYDVAISGSRFAPHTVEVREGDVVRWNNHDGISHTARSSGNWDTGTIPANGGSSSITMTTAGTYGYVCAFHSGMTGTVRVLAQTANTPPSVAILTPTTGATVSGVATIEVAATDVDDDILTVTLRIDGGAFVDVPRSGNSYFFVWDTLNITNGAHTLTARATDGDETTTSGTITVTVNNLPTITMVSPGLEASATIGEIVAVTGTTTAPYGSVVTVQVSIDDGPWQNVTGRTFWSFGWNTTHYLAGEHSVQARVRDGTNTILSPLRVVTLHEPVPDEPPVLLIFTPMEGQPVAGLVNVSGTVTDPDGSVPVVEVSVDGGAWQNATGRDGAAWWYHWLPEGRAPGPVSIQVRATADDATVTSTRRVLLSDQLPPVVIEPIALREGSAVLVRVLSANATPEPLAFARVVLVNASGAVVEEALTNATGVASFPPVRPGSYEARAYAPGAAGKLPIEITSLYSITAEPLLVDFERPVAIVVSVQAERGVRNVPVQLFGAPLPGGMSDVARTGGDGNASVALQPLTAGELSIFVNGNDSGLRVRVAPTVLVAWTPDAPKPGDTVTARFTLNDAARTPVAEKNLTIDVPGMGRQPVRTDATGAVSVRPNATGTLRAFVPRDGFPGIVHALAVRAPPIEPELSGLATRAGPARLQLSVMVKNAGDIASAFTLDAVASNGVAAVQESARTALLAPGEEERVTFTMQIGPGEYDLLVTARNSAASITGVGRVVDAGVPPPMNRSTEPLALPAALAANEEEKESPAAALGALAALAGAAFARRRR